MRLWKRRKPANTSEKPQSTISDVGRGLYGPDDTKERPVSRFERERVRGKRSGSQLSA